MKVRFRRPTIKMGPVKLNRKSITIGSGKLKTNFNSRGAQASLRIGPATLRTGRTGAKGSKSPRGTIRTSSSSLADLLDRRQSPKAKVYDLVGFAALAISLVALCTAPPVGVAIFIGALFLFMRANSAETAFVSALAETTPAAEIEAPDAVDDEPVTE